MWAVECDARSQLAAQAVNEFHHGSACGATAKARLSERRRRDKLLFPPRCPGLLAARYPSPRAGTNHRRSSPQDAWCDLRHYRMPTNPLRSTCHNPSRSALGVLGLLERAWPSDSLFVVLGEERVLRVYARAFCWWSRSARTNPCDRNFPERPKPRMRRRMGFSSSSRVTSHCSWAEAHPSRLKGLCIHGGLDVGQVKPAERSPPPHCCRAMQGPEKRNPAARQGFVWSSRMRGNRAGFTRPTTGSDSAGRLAEQRWSEKGRQTLRS